MIAALLVAPLLWVLAGAGQLAGVVEIEDPVDAYDWSLQVSDWRPWLRGTP